MLPTATQFRAPRVNFDWTPKAGPVSITVAGHTYPYSRQQDGVPRVSDTRYVAYSTPARTTLTFTADITTFNAVAIRYRWDFGDNTEAFGPIVSKVYSFSNPTIAVTLTVRDSNGMEGVAMKPLNLIFTDPVILRQSIHVGSEASVVTAVMTSPTLVTSTTQITSE